MTGLSTERELIEQIRRLSGEQKRRVLDFIRSMQAPGIPGPALLQRAHEVNFGRMIWKKSDRQLKKAVRG